MRESLIFLKLGGSLITDKTRPYTLQTETLGALAAALAAFRQQHPETRLLLGHGSGSFGHTAAKRWRTRDGLPGSGLPPEDYWPGFAEVWYQASRLHRAVIEALHAAGLPAVGFSPASSVVAAEGRIAAWDLTPLRGALTAGLLPVVYGDVVFDRAWGGTILSTEDLFTHLAAELAPRRILLAGLEPGIWADFPSRERLIPLITPGSFPAIAPSLAGSHGTDVTGGMAAKVRLMLDLLERTPSLDEIVIFAGDPVENLTAALTNQPVGTRLRKSDR